MSDYRPVKTPVGDLLAVQDALIAGVKGSGKSQFARCDTTCANGHWFPDPLDYAAGVPEWCPTCHIAYVSTGTEWERDSSRDGEGW